MYMEFKSNLVILRDVLGNPGTYKASQAQGAIDITVSALVEERKRTKERMATIVAAIDKLCVARSNLLGLQSNLLHAGTMTLRN